MGLCKPRGEQIAIIQLVTSRHKQRWIHVIFQPIFFSTHTFNTCTADWCFFLVWSCMISTYCIESAMLTTSKASNNPTGVHKLIHSMSCKGAGLWSSALVIVLFLSRNTTCFSCLHIDLYVSTLVCGKYLTASHHTQSTSVAVTCLLKPADARLCIRGWAPYMYTVLIVESDEQNNSKC